MQPTACLIIIGNEILSGRTQDKNIAWLATQLNETGIKLAEVRVIPDHGQTIVDTLNSCRKAFTYVFTTGGIGPTHDDITTEFVAKAFGRKVIRHPEAEKLLLKHYKPEQVNAARMKMADVPEGATLITNPVSAAPGYCVENVFVMAGVPVIMQAMFASLKSQLRGGAKTLSKSISAPVTEGNIAAGLTAIQNQFPDVDIGSYPFMRDGKLGTSLVCRSTQTDSLQRCYDAVKQMVLGFTEDISEHE